MSDILVPYFKIFISGKELEPKYYNHIQAIDIKYTSIGSCTLSMKVTDPDMLFIEGSMIVESTPIKVVYGTNALKRTIQSTSDTTTKSSLDKAQEGKFEGYVSVIDCDFPENGQPSVNIHCMDKTHLMNRKPKTRTWENTTESAVAEKIFREYGFKVKISDSKVKKESIQQSDATDIAFITKLVDEIDTAKFLTYVEGETAYFIERQAPPPKHQFNYRLPPYNLYSFNPRINKENKKEAFNKMDIDLKTLKIETTVVTPNLAKLGSIQVKNSTTRK